jgi:ATP diphosphatase
VTSTDRHNNPLSAGVTGGGFEESSAYTRAMSSKSSEGSVSKLKSLLDIMARLRDPEGGCPWDLEQDFSSISPHTIEEAYEVDEAIALGDLDGLRDELGDLLFQVVFQARIAEEQGAFDFGGVTQAIVSKLIRRHPHIFADAATPTSVRDQAVNWESIKDAERKAKADSRGGAADPFAGIPRKLPALARSAKIAGRLERIEIDTIGDPPSGSSSAAIEILADLGSTFSRVEHALATNTALREVGAMAGGVQADDVGDVREVVGVGVVGGGGGVVDRSARLRLVGEGLRAWVRLAREFGVDPEQALREVDDETIIAIRQASRDPASK